jgi:hypothetical protein
VLAAAAVAAGAQGTPGAHCAWGWGGHGAASAAAAAAGSQEGAGVLAAEGCADRHAAATALANTL